MSYSSLDFTFKFFHPPQRTVSCHNGLLDIRTKHTIARDRLLVAEQRFLDVERQKSAGHIQLLAFEQKQLEKRLSSLHSLDQSFQLRHRSISETNLSQTTSWNNNNNNTLEMTHSKLYANLHHSNQNLLSLPKLDDIQGRLSAYSDGDLSENRGLISDFESDEEDNSKSMNKKAIQLPIVAVIPPDEND